MPNIPAARPQYVRETDAFIAMRSGGGGFMRFGGFYRPWKWFLTNAVCAECGATLGYQRCEIRADGMVKNATYFVCNSIDRHPIRREADVRWMIGKKARDEKLQAKGTIKDVQFAYEWLKAVPVYDELEEVPF